MSRSVESGVIFFARLLLATLFIWGGAMKLVGYAAFTTYLTNLNVPLVSVMAPIVIAIQLLGGLLLVVGFKVRTAAVVLALYAVLAAVLGYDFWNATDPQVQHDLVVNFWKNFGLAGGFLLLCVTGAGAVSVDGMRRPSSSFLK